MSNDEIPESKLNKFLKEQGFNPLGRVNYTPQGKPQENVAFYTILRDLNQRNKEIVVRFRDSDEDSYNCDLYVRQK